MREITIAVVAAVVVFGLGRLAAPGYIGWLRRRKLGDRPRDELTLHQAKAGTPTMGGWLIVGPTLLVGAALGGPAAWPALAGMVLFAALGAVDDWRKLNRGTGLGFPVRWKFLLHGAVALALALWVTYGLGQTATLVPLFGTIDLGPLAAPFAALVIFSAAAGVNETDGLDGLASGVTVAVLLALLVIAVTQANGASALLCLAAIGAVLAFLWDNAHPAAVFMGDTGSLALGALVGVLTVQLGAALLLPVIGAVYVMELGSVIIQVAYFKRTGGKRVFKMAPIHHHFELVGWQEVQVVTRFWIIAAVGGLAGLALYFGTVAR